MKKMLAMTNDEKIKHHAAAICYLYLDVSVKKMDEILTNFETFLWKKC